MTIESYRFGRIEIDGRAYSADIIVTPERVVDSWWRKQGHRLTIEDVGDIVAAAPDVLVVGTGYFGRMAVTDDVRRHLEARGIRLHVARTRQAVEEFNRLQAERTRVVAALHLTC